MVRERERTTNPQKEYDYLTQFTVHYRFPYTTYLAWEAAGWCQRWKQFHPWLGKAFPSQPVILFPIALLSNHWASKSNILAMPPQENEEASGTAPTSENPSNGSSPNPPSNPNWSALRVSIKYWFPKCVFMLSIYLLWQSTESCDNHCIISWHSYWVYWKVILLFLLAFLEIFIYSSPDFICCISIK